MLQYVCNYSSAMVMLPNSGEYLFGSIRYSGEYGICRVFLSYSYFRVRVHRLLNYHHFIITYACMCAKENHKRRAIMGLVILKSLFGLLIKSLSYCIHVIIVSFCRCTCTLISTGNTVLKDSTTKYIYRPLY